MTNWTRVEWSNPCISTKECNGFLIFISTCSFVVTLEFKATGKDGIMFYVADNALNPKQYASLEMVNGRLQFKFTSSSSVFTVTTTKDYSQEAKWNLVINFFDFCIWFYSKLCNILVFVQCCYCLVAKTLQQRESNLDLPSSYMNNCFDEYIRAILKQNGNTMLWKYDNPP